MRQSRCIDGFATAFHWSLLHKLRSSPTFPDKNSWRNRLGPLGQPALSSKVADVFTALIPRGNDRHGVNVCNFPMMKSADLSIRERRSRDDGRVAVQNLCLPPATAAVSSS